MYLKSNKQDRHLTEIIYLLSMYQTLHLEQLKKFYPELTEAKLVSLIKRLEKSGRISYSSDSNLIKHSVDCTINENLVAAFWLLLDFMPDVTYHTVSDFPVSLSFYSDSDSYDIICIPEGKEAIYNLALSHMQNDDPHRLVVIENTEQIPLISFEGISAFCIVSEKGQIQYYKLQGGTDN